MEQKKLIWVSISVGAFFVLLLAIGAFAFYRGTPTDARKTPVTFQSGPKTVTDPSDWVRVPNSVPGFEAPKPGTEGTAETMDVVVDSATPSTTQMEKNGDTVTVNVLMDPPGTSAAEKSVLSSEPAIKTQAKPVASQGKIPATVKPAAKPAETAKKASMKTVTVSEYWIQAFSTKTRSRAEDSQRYFAQSGLPAIVITKDIDGSLWYRIRIGPYASKSEADSWAAKIRKLKGYEESYVSKDSYKKTVTN